MCCLCSVVNLRTNWHNFKYSNLQCGTFLPPLLAVRVITYLHNIPLWCHTLCCCSQLRHYGLPPSALTNQSLLIDVNASLPMCRWGNIAADTRFKTSTTERFTWRKQALASCQLVWQQLETNFHLYVKVSRCRFTIWFHELFGTMAANNIILTFTRQYKRYTSNLLFLLIKNNECNSSNFAYKPWAVSQKPLGGSITIHKWSLLTKSWRAPACLCTGHKDGVWLD